MDSPQWGSYVVRKEKIKRRHSSNPVENVPLWGSHVVQEASSDVSLVSPTSSEDEEPVCSKTSTNRKRRNKASEIRARQSVIHAQLPKNFRAPRELTQREQLLWLQRNRTILYWVKCSNKQCHKWRLLKYIVDPNDIADEWVCSMNQDEEHNTCGSPQIQPFCLRELIDIRYNIGSIVMAKLPGYPWWPAMIDDDPEFGKFYWLNAQETKTEYYHVIFFDKEIERYWQKIEAVLPFNEITISMYDTLKKQYKKRLTENIALAKSALKMDIAERLEKFSFVSNFLGPIYSYKHNIADFIKAKNLPPYCDTDDEGEEEVEVEKNQISLQVKDKNDSVDLITFISESSSDSEETSSDSEEPSSDSEEPS
ncbi:zinc finger CW-type PWWP domain protein 1-like isoform X2 [Rhodnius prolixus]|uniref:zinc finger CW-type PWWP domain protein 1-like isoform X2 n=1 Tax=Rhodnius prolixus TaxID=13249 RepID=UPI003D18CBD6